MNKKKEILIVDDVSVNLRFLYETLKNNYAIRITTDGELAIESAKAKCPDLIILDVKMPNLDGFEVCKILKSNLETKDIPILFISGSVNSDDKKKCFAAGGIGFLIKPFDSNELKIQIESILS